MLVLGTIVDLLLAALLIGISGFVLERPEGGHGEISGVLMWSFGLLMCLGCPVTGFALRGWRRPGSGVAIAWLPPVAALVVTFLPYHPY